MKQYVVLFSFVLLFLTTFSGCSVIADIFKAGMVVGILVILVVIALIYFIFSKVSKRN